MFMGVYSCTGPKWRGLGNSAYGLRCSSGGGPCRTPVSCQEQWNSTSGEMLTLVEEYKQLVLTQPLLMSLKTEKRSLSLNTDATKESGGGSHSKTVIGLHQVQEVQVHHCRHFGTRLPSHTEQFRYFKVQH